MNTPIKFGTDGWRAIIADTFTFENVRYASQAAADYFKTVKDREKAIFVGYDVRFQSPKFAAVAADVIAANGFRVLLMDRPYPTPYISFEVQRRRFAGGIVLTASHNPAEFNGFKVKAYFGGSASPAITKQIEANLASLQPGEVRTGAPSSAIENIAPEDAYFAHLRGLLDWDRITRSGLKAVVDSMHGSGGRIIEEMLKGTKCTVETIRGNPDPMFGGVNPEPMMPQLKPLCERVRQTGSAVGLATDGDADRLGVVDETGQFVNTLQTLSLLLLHTYRNKGWRGAVARTYSQSLLVPRIASALGVKLYECPIGFKNIAEIMLEEELLIGGEESGGVGLSRHLPERDGIFVNLLVLDMLAATGKTVTALIREMWQEFGEFHFDRADLHVPIEAGQTVVQRLASDPPKSFAGRRVKEVGTLDGSKVFLENDAWILFRQSGTEPLLRVYCEATSKDAVREIMTGGMKFVEQFVPGGVQR